MQDAVVTKVTDILHQSRAIDDKLRLGTSQAVTDVEVLLLKSQMLQDDISAMSDKLHSLDLDLDDTIHRTKETIISTSILAGVG